MDTPSDHAPGTIAIHPYFALLVVVCLLIALSPVITALTGFRSYDRTFDVISILLLAFRLARIASTPTTVRLATPVILFLTFFVAAAMYNAWTSRLFSPVLLLLDSKIVLFLVCVWTFSGAVTVDNALRRKATDLLCYACLVGVVTFLLVHGTRERLTLIDESNYMIAIFSIAFVLFVSNRSIRTASPAWYLCLVALVAACLVAQSRTGFATIALITCMMLAASGRLLHILVLVYLGIAAVLVNGDAIIAVLTRGETSAIDIDRYVFLLEFLRWWDKLSIQELLFGNNIGTYLDYRPTLMQHWINVLAAEHDLRPKLAPFIFHSAYLRIFADLGVAGGLAAIGILAGLLYRTTGPYITAIILVSGVSMSTFYLSSLLPIVIFAQIFGTAQLPAVSGRRVETFRDERSAAFSLARMSSPADRGV